MTSQTELDRIRQIHPSLANMPDELLTHALSNGYMDINGKEDFSPPPSIPTASAAVPPTMSATMRNTVGQSNPQLNIQNVGNPVSGMPPGSGRLPENLMPGEVKPSFANQFLGSMVRSSFPVGHPPSGGPRPQPQQRELTSKEIVEMYAPKGREALPEESGMMAWLRRGEGPPAQAARGLATYGPTRSNIVSGLENLSNSSNKVQSLADIAASKMEKEAELKAELEAAKQRLNPGGGYDPNYALNGKKPVSRSSQRSYRDPTDMVVDAAETVDNPAMMNKMKDLYLQDKTSLDTQIYTPGDKFTDPETGARYVYKLNDKEDDESGFWDLIE